jgi:Transposase DDE domain group 1
MEIRETVKNSLDYIVRLVRNGYRTDIPIIVTCDSGFFDQKLFDFFEDQLGILYVCTGKMYDDIGEHVAGLNEDAFFIVEKHRSVNECSQWKCAEFFNGRKSWQKERRAIYTVHIMESNQRLLLGQESIYYTNIGDSDELTQQLREAGGGDYLEAAGIVKLAHQRGEAELVHRHFKEFGFQQMPFKRFTSNEAFFYMMVLGFNLYESYKWDVCKETGIVPLSCQPNTFRRRLIDFAGKIVRHGRRTILKVTAQVRERLQLDRVWILCNRGPEVLLI